ncbi:hypothetical protein LOTGIDRAFT_172254 [Lottia gigantea]|uniref:Uncharacterized protein n=1 Tax=Lottia gigantea TaxID=225164 RepID=V4AE05_LOTGI|nr:hypothetical protein LOTGIDRAFT_172254 [Lottia gigantea]ESP02254.1 hypothetical protein LOTGIDRAFT_172254 [Lottia gigantea]
MPKRTHTRDVSEEDVGLIPTTAEDRLTNILIDKLIKRRLVLPSASVANANTTVLGPSSRALNSPLPTGAATIPTTSVAASIPITTSITDSTKVQVCSATTFVTASITSDSVPTTATTACPSVLSFDATQLFPLAAANLNDGVHISIHVAEKMKQDIWSNRFIDMSALLPGTSKSHLSIDDSPSTYLVEQYSSRIVASGSHYPWHKNVASK